MDCRGYSSFTHALNQQGRPSTGSNIQTIDTRTMDSSKDTTYPHQEMTPSPSGHIGQYQPYYPAQSYSAYNPQNYHPEGSYYRPNVGASASPYSYHESFPMADLHDFGGDAPHQEVKAELSKQHNQWNPGESRESSSNGFAGQNDTGFRYEIPRASFVNTQQHILPPQDQLVPTCGLNKPTSKNQTCHFWRNGRCIYSEEVCFYAHREIDSKDSQPVKCESDRASTGYSNTDDAYSPQPAFLEPSFPAPHETQTSEEQQKNPEEPTNLSPFPLTNPATSELPNPYRPALSPTFPPRYPDSLTANAITAAYQEISHLKNVVSAQKTALSDAKMIALQEAKHYASEHERVSRLAEGVRAGTANSKTVMHAMDEMAPRLLQRKQTMETLAKRVDCGEGTMKA